MIDTLVVTVPSAAQTGKISVKVLNGTPALSTVDFTVLTSVPPTDMDADGLIDITTFAQLDAIRYDLDGDGRPTSAGQTAWQTAFSAVAASDDDAAVRDASTGFTGYELMNSLDFAGTKWENPTGGAFTGTHETGGWAPIGDNNTNSGASRFSATFEGNNNTISNLYINRDTQYIGLFGYARSGSEIRNLGTVSGSVISAYTGSGGTIGGLVGRSASRITACYSTVAVTGASGSNARTGGLIGHSTSGIFGCYSTGDVTGASGSDAHTGGLVGESTSRITACYSTGDVTGGSGNEANTGGLVGRNTNEIFACYSTSSVTDISGSISGNNDTGGFVGESNRGSIIACYSAGVVTGGSATFVNTGGLGGHIIAATVNACYSASVVTGGSGASPQTGGLIGVLAISGITGATVTNVYFDRTVASGSGSSAIGSNAFAGFHTVTNVSGKTTTELQTPTAYAGIYSNWNVDVDNGQPIGVDNGAAAGDPTADNPWDFGMATQYPALQVDFDRSGTSSVAEFGAQLRTALRVLGISPSHGHSATIMTITGTSFSTTAADNTVTFLGAEGAADNVVATVSAATTTSLTVTVPVGAMTGKIQVAVSGEMATSTDDFTVLIFPPDTDTDGLIDITTLDQLDAIRYDLDGDGRPTSAGQTAWHDGLLGGCYG